MNQALRPLTCFVTLAMLAAFSSDATALTRHKQGQHTKKAHAAAGAKQKHPRHTEAKKRKPAHVVAVRPKPAPPVEAPPPAAAEPALSGDLAALKNGIDLVRKGK